MKKLLLNLVVIFVVASCFTPVQLDAQTVVVGTGDGDNTPPPPPPPSIGDPLTPEELTALENNTTVNVTCENGSASAEVVVPINLNRDLGTTGFVRFTFRLNGTEVDFRSFTIGSEIGTQTLDNLEPGSYRVEIEVAIAGENDFGLANFEITEGQCDIIVEEPITLSFASSAADGQTFVQGQLTVEANASSSEGAIEKVELFVDGNFVRTERVAPYQWGMDRASNPNNAELEDLSVGIHTLRIVATDDAGNTREETITIEIVPSDISLSFATPSNNQVVTQGMIGVVANASTNTDAIEEVSLFVDGNFVRTERIDPYEWGASHPNQTDEELQNLSVGTHTLTLIATDNTGNTAEETITIEVVAAPSPITLSFATPSDNQVVTQGMIGVVANASSTAGSISEVSLFADGNFVRTERVDPYEWGASHPNQTAFFFLRLEFQYLMSDTSYPNMSVLVL